MATTRIRRISLGEGVILKFTCEPCEGQYLDTKVEINGEYLCTISYPDMDAFIAEISQPVEKYRI